MPVTRRDFVRTLFVASQATLASRLLPGNLRADEPDNKAALNFAAIGDWGRKGRPDQMQVSEQMAIACKAAAASFVVSLGDNFYEHGVESINDPGWLKSFEQVYTAESLQVPWHVILGNHDYCGNCDAQIEYGNTHPRWHLPARYHSQTHDIDASNKLEIIYTDTNPFIKEYQHNELIGPNIASQDPAAQLEWLEKTLARSTARWKFVMGHHPIYSSGLAHGNQPELIEKFLPLFQKYKVHTYFAGHDHDLEYLKVGDLNLVISGAGSEHRPVKSPNTSPFSDAVSGFVMVAVTPEAVQMRFIDNHGSNLYTAYAHHPALG